jgi:BirA family biotin operon repressor/biotin-[acetyl-CoA-carboxylase] ligase
MVIGRRVLRLGEVTSTNDVAKGLGRDGEEEGLVVLAKSQTIGRGRMGRGWSSPEGGLYLSVLLRPKMRSADLLRMTVFSCVPVAQAIEEVCGIDVQLKWPNDLMVQGKKVGGILVEGVSKGADLDFIALGIGVNVNARPERIGENEATSLNFLLGHNADMDALLENLLHKLRGFYKGMKEGDLNEDEYTHRSCTLGRHIEARVGRETFTGKALYLAPDGALVIKSDEGLVLRLSWVNETSIRITNSEELDGITLRKD